MSDTPKQPPIVFDNLTPTLFVDYNGTMHRGNAFVNAETGDLTLDTGNEPLEFAPLLEELLAPYPRVEIVLTTSWLNSFSLDQAARCMTFPLSQRVVGSTHEYKVPFGYLQNGCGKTYAIRSYVFKKRLRNWLALDDAVYGATNLSSDLLQLEPHLVLLDSNQGIGDPSAQQRIRHWLQETACSET